MMSGIFNYAYDKLKNRLAARCQVGNVGGSERVLSVVSGGFILGMGFKSVLKNPLSGISEITIGAALIYRGVAGYCPVKDVIENQKPEATVIEHRYFVK